MMESIDTMQVKIVPKPNIEDDLGKVTGKISLEIFLQDEAVLQLLSRSNIFFTKKVGISDYLALKMCRALVESHHVQKFEYCSIDNLSERVDALLLSEQNSILLVDLSSAKNYPERIITENLEKIKGKKCVLWLSSFLSCVNRRLLIQFNSFFAFPCSQSELDVLIDILLIPNNLIEALCRSWGSVLYVSDKPSITALPLANPCIVDLPTDAVTYIAQEPHISVELLYDDMPSGLLFKYYTSFLGSPLLYQIKNVSFEQRELSLEYKWEDGKWKKTNLRLEPGETYECRPTLVLGTEYVNLEVALPVSLDVRVCDKSKRKAVLYQKSFRVYLSQWNKMYWMTPRTILLDDRNDLSELITAFVTPSSPAIKGAYQKIKIVNKELNWDDYDDQGSILAKIKSIYNFLKDKKIRYDDLNLPIGSQIFGTQVVRLPDQTLSDGCGNCIDMTVLFASLLERAQIDPIIVVTHNHAFIGWAESLNEESKENFLEAVGIIHGTSGFPKTFDEAVSDAFNQYKSIEEKETLKNRWVVGSEYARKISVSDHRCGNNPIVPLEPRNLIA